MRKLRNHIHIHKYSYVLLIAFLYQIGRMFLGFPVDDKFALGCGCLLIGIAFDDWLWRMR